MKEINDYLSKADKEIANNVIYRVYGMPGPIFMEEENSDAPTPEPGPDYSIPFYVENITQEDETLTIAGYDMSGSGGITISNFQLNIQPTEPIGKLLVRQVKRH